jgi:DNA-binding NtrC family response regulator
VDPLASAVEDGPFMRFAAKQRAGDRSKQIILRTLTGVGGNRRLAATKLGIGLRTLYEKLKRYDLR